MRPAQLKALLRAYDTVTSAVNNVGEIVREPFVLRNSGSW
jgi:hypothetical protein